MVRISILIASSRDNLELKRCLSSILINNFKSYEVLLVSQNFKLYKPIIDYKNLSRKVKFIKENKCDKSVSLNKAINVAKGEIFTFTDDDCIVSKDWLSRIDENFKEDSRIMGLFGNVLPYEPEKHKGLFCPSTINLKKKKYLTKPVVHWKSLGSGNNMAFRREVFEKYGNFKEWLSPGTKSYCGEDSEFVNRLLHHGLLVVHDPDVLVFHNSWLTKKEYALKKLHYLCGMMASYGYLGLKGVKIGNRVVRKQIYYIKENIKGDLIRLFKLKKNSLQDFVYRFKEFIYSLKGLFIAYIHQRE